MIRRRRAIFRSTFRPFRPIIFNRRIRQDLQNAQRLMDNGQYDQAIPIFNNLGEIALERGMVRRGALLFLQASHAEFLMGNIEAGKKQLMKGLNILAENKNWQLLYHVCNRTTKELESMNQGEIVNEVKNWQKTVFPKDFVPASRGDKLNIAKPIKLPPKCPYCGATVSPEEIEWVDDNSASCSYCGSIIQG